jgi:predicted DCC family thiol-disulfide oxidoreductase YuxK
MRVIPAPLLDLGYRLVARTRYRFFGRAETCVVPDPTLADRFLDEAA